MNNPESDKPLPELSRWFLWTDSPAAVSKLIRGRCVLCGLLFVLDVITHRHAYVPGEGVWGFYGIVGFVAFTGIVLGAKQLRRLILRSEDFYSTDSIDAEDYPEPGLERLVHRQTEHPIVAGNAVHDVDEGTRS